MRGGSRVDAPFRREHRLLVMHPDMTRLLRFTHKVADGLVLGQLEVEICLHTTAMHMCRHRVPHATSSQFRHTHLQLTGGQHLIHQHLIDVTLVARLQRSHTSHHSIRLRHLTARIGAMRRRGVEVKEGRLLRIHRCKSHLTVTYSYIECLLIAQFEALVTNFHNTRSTYIIYTHLTTSGKERRLQRVDSLQRQYLVHWHSATHHHTVIHRIHHVHLVLNKQVFYEEIAAQTGCVVMTGILRMSSITYFVVSFHLPF